MKAALASFFWPPVTDGDYLNTARKRCLIVMCSVAAVVGLASGLRNFEASFAAYPVQTLVSALAPLILLACPVLLVVTNNLRAVALFFLAIIFIALFAVPVIAGGMHSRATLFMLPWAMMTTLFLGWKEGIGAGLLVFAAYLFLHLGGPAIPPGVQEMSSETLSSWLFIGLTMTLVMVIGSAAIFQREMEQAAVKLSEARIEAEAANCAKSRFLANMSHEIRTPMNGILGMTEMLESTPLNGQQKIFADTISYSGQSLLAIINDILDLSKIEAGDEKLISKPFELRALAEHLRMHFEPKAQTSNIQFRLAFDESLPKMVRGDERALRRILFNLLNNALKFTNEGAVCINISGTVKGSDLDLTIDIDDTGIGIPADYVGSIFDKFAQAESSTTRRYDGTGAGLAISRLLARAMGGDISVRSVEGQGSTFSVRITLPIAQTPAQPASETDQNSADAKTSGPNLGSSASGTSPTTDIRILVAEDNEVNRLVLKHLLNTQSYDVTFAADGREAFEAFKRENFDVILMDISMPNMDGYEATKAIRAHESQHCSGYTPIICVTAHTLEEHRAKSLASGMNDYIPKPVGKEKLWAKLNAWTGAAAFRGNASPH